MDVRAAIYRVRAFQKLHKRMEIRKVFRRVALHREFRGHDGDEYVVAVGDRGKRIMFICPLTMSFQPVKLIVRLSGCLKFNLLVFRV